jgi:uncharacterized protein (DUF2252 family)
VALIDRQNADRVPDLVPLRYERLAASPLGFFEGADAVMADDLAGTPTSGIMVQLCGDAHVGNFGLYRTPAGRLVFDTVDFDETHPGPWEWDVKRLLAGLAVAGRENGFTPGQRRILLLRTGRAYRAAVRGFAAMSNLEMWFTQADAAALQRHRWLGRGVDGRSRTRRQGPTEVIDGRRRLVTHPPSLVSASELPGTDSPHVEEDIAAILDDYRATLPGDSQLLLDHFRLVEVARSAGSAGATGTLTWIVLLAGKETEEPLLLQVREAHRSVLYPLSSVETSSNHGQRIVTGQRLVQAAGDIFLAWQRIAEGDGRRRDYYVRELRDWLPRPALDRMSLSSLATYGELCGWTLARAHARSGDRIALAAYLGETDEFEDAIAHFAEAYADQNLQDFERLRNTPATGPFTHHD